MVGAFILLKYVGLTCLNGECLFKTDVEIYRALVSFNSILTNEEIVLYKLDESDL
jgi:hypothetical protein